MCLQSCRNYCPKRIITTFSINTLYALRNTVIVTKYVKRFSFSSFPQDWRMVQLKIHTRNPELTWWDYRNAIYLAEPNSLMHTLFSFSKSGRSQSPSKAVVTKDSRMLRSRFFGCHSLTWPESRAVLNTDSESHSTVTFNGQWAQFSLF